MFYRYYLEIKSRILLLLISGILIILVGYIFKEILLSIVLNSYNTNNNSHIELSYFIFTDVLEVFNVYVCLIFFLAKQVLFFQLCYHLLMFLARGLTKSEYRYFLQLFSLSSCFFVLAVVLFKKFLFPFSWNFFLSFKNFVTFKSLTVHFEAKLLNYVMFFTDFYFSCVLYFQFFLLPFFLIIYFKVEPNSFKSAVRATNTAGRPAISPAAMSSASADVKQSYKYPTCSGLCNKAVLSASVSKFT